MTCGCRWCANGWPESLSFPVKPKSYTRLGSLALIAEDICYKTPERPTLRLQIGAATLFAEDQTFVEFSKFCDLIIGMEQTEISPRPVVGAIVVISGLAVSFLLWLLYVHHASADFAGRWMFLPALNALLNGLCAVALCVGLYFIKHRRREAHRTSMLLAFAFSSVFLVSYIVNHALHGDTIFPGHGPVRTLYLSILASHIILSNRTLYVPHLALRVHHWRGGFRVPQGVCVLGPNG